MVLDMETVDIIKLITGILTSGGAGFLGYRVSIKMRKKEVEEKSVDIESKEISNWSSKMKIMDDLIDSMRENFQKDIQHMKEQNDRLTILLREREDLLNTKEKKYKLIIQELQKEIDELKAKSKDR